MRACGVGEWVCCLWASRVHEHRGHRGDHQEDDDEAGKPIVASHCFFMPSLSL